MKSIFLVGFMGAGKTTVGSILSEKMNFDFCDTDQMIVEEESREIVNFSVYLKASYEEIFSRIKKDTTRPLLNNEDPYNTGLKIFESRKELYDSFLLFVETDFISPELVADKIYNLYRNKT